MHLPVRRKLENSRLLREDVERRATVMRGMPEVVAFHTTEKCNLRCVMCPRALGQGRLQLPRTRLAAICEALFPTARKVALSAAAGEPMLADFDLVLDRALAHEVRVDVVTNGTLLDAAAYREARPVFDHVNVSVDCHVPEVYERIRAGGSFARLEANLRGIAEERARRPDDVLLSLSAVVMRSTLPHLVGLVGFAREVGADGLILQRLSHGVKATPEEDPGREPGGAAVLRTLDGVREAARAVGLNLFVSDFGLENLIVGPLREKVPPQMLSPHACWYVVQHLGVQPTGEAYPCAMPTTFKLGDLTHQSPEEVWNGPVAQRLRAEHYARRGNLYCSGCVHASHLRAKGPSWLVEWRRRWSMRRADRRHRRERERSANG